MASETPSTSTSSRGKHEVRLRVYDLSGGLAKQMSSMLLGKQVDGIWHTGVVVHGLEFFFGGGIQALPPASVEASFGIRPVQDTVLGHTDVDLPTVREFLRGVSPRFTQATYDLFHNNCNNFSDEFSKFLLGKGIPSHIIELPAEVLASPLGRQLRPLVTQMQNSMYSSVGGGATDPFSALGAARGSAPAPSAVAAPAAAPAPAPAPAVPRTPILADPEPPTSILATHNKAMVSADTAILSVVVDRLVKRGALSADEAPLARAAIKRMADGDGGGDVSASSSKMEEPRVVCDGDVCRIVPPSMDEIGGITAAGAPATDPFVPILLRLMKSDNNKIVGPTLCLARAAVLHSHFRAALIADGTTLRHVLTQLDGGAYTTVTPRLMALATLANLVASDSGFAFLTESDMEKVIDAASRALARDQRNNMRHLGAAVLHNLALRAPVDGEALSDHMVQVLCALCDELSQDTGDEEAARRRLMGVGVVVKRAGGTAAELMEALGSLDTLRGITTDGSFKPPLRALCAEVVGMVDTMLAAAGEDDGELD